MKLIQNIKHIARSMKDTYQRGRRNAARLANPAQVEYDGTPGAFGRQEEGRRPMSRHAERNARRVRRNRAKYAVAKQSRKVNR